MESFQDLAKRYIDQRHKLTVAEFEAENQNIPNVSPWRNLIGIVTILNIYIILFFNYKYN